MLPGAKVTAQHRYPNRQKALRSLQGFNTHLYDKKLKLKNHGAEHHFKPFLMGLGYYPPGLMTALAVFHHSYLGLNYLLWSRAVGYPVT